MPDNNRTKDRQWEVEMEDRPMWVEDEPIVVDADDQDALLATLIDASTILRLLGGGLTVVAGREQTRPDGPYVTRSYVFAWRSYAPSRRKEQPEDEHGTDA